MWSGPDHVVTRLSADAFRCVILSRGNDVRDLSNRGTSELTFLILSVKKIDFYDVTYLQRKSNTISANIMNETTQFK